MVYKFFDSGYNKGAPNAPGSSFVEIIKLPIISRLAPGMFEVPQDDVAVNARVSGFTRDPSRATSMISIDSVVYKIKLVNHYTDDSPDVIGIRMWESR